MSVAPAVDAPDHPTALALDPASRLVLRPLSFVEQGADVYVGSPETGVFLAIPQIGAHALRLLVDGGSIADAAASTRTLAGEEVDVLAFAEALIDAGLVLSVDGRPTTPSADLPRPRTRLDWLAPEVVRPLFSTSMWVLYGTLFVACAAVFVTQPQFWPSFEDVFFYPNPAVSVVGMIGSGILLAFCHEVCHWIAARAAGIRPRFTISLRWFFPVFETDLSELWSLSPRQRYAAFMAGMAWDTVVLSTCLGLRVAWSNGYIDVPPLLIRYAGLVVMLEVLALTWQTLVFLRTDLYAVLLTRLRCFNLYRVSSLELRRRFRLLGPRGAAELRQAHPRDLRAARWFGLLTLAGMVWAGWFFVSFFIPGTIVVAGWTFESVSGASLSSAVFWEALAITAVATFQTLLPAAIFVWQRISRRRGLAT
jgi:putative peptide zinc metalloprotease protein